MRNLEREIQNIARKMARKVVTDKVAKAEITAANVNDFLGILKYREFWLEKHNEIGLTTGLAWTEVGGSVLVTEAAIMEGKGRLTLTGKLGDVMQESAQAAMSYIRSSPGNWACRRISTATSTFTCTCRKARFRRTGLRQASRFAPRSSAR